MIHVDFLEGDTLVENPRIELRGSEASITVELIQLLFTYVYKFDGRGSLNDMEIKTLTPQETLWRLMPILDTLIDWCGDEECIKMQKSGLRTVNTTEFADILKALKKEEDDK